jgi:hypothetical protein
MPFKKLYGIKIYAEARSGTMASSVKEHALETRRATPVNSDFFVFFPLLFGVNLLYSISDVFNLLFWRMQSNRKSSPYPQFHELVPLASLPDLSRYLSKMSRACAPSKSHAVPFRGEAETHDRQTAVPLPFLRFALMV